MICYNHQENIFELKCVSYCHKPESLADIHETTTDIAAPQICHEVGGSRSHILDDRYVGTTDDRRLRPKRDECGDIMEDSSSKCPA
jgi:hypothetical protein